jgi:hypothetical protein
MRLLRYFTLDPTMTISFAPALTFVLTFIVLPLFLEPFVGDLNGFDGECVFTSFQPGLELHGVASPGWKRSHGANRLRWLERDSRVERHGVTPATTCRTSLRVG